MNKIAAVAAASAMAASTFAIAPSAFAQSSRNGELLSCHTAQGQYLAVTRSESQRPRPKKGYGTSFKSATWMTSGAFIVKGFNDLPAIEVPRKSANRTFYVKSGAEQVTVYIFQRKAPLNYCTVQTVVAAPDWNGGDA